MAPRRDFPVYTDGGEEEASGNDAAAAGSARRHEIPMFEDRGRFEKGAGIGTLHLDVTPRPGGTEVDCVATFEFSLEDKITAEGTLPAQPRPVGPGRIPVTDASGRFKHKLDRDRDLVIEVKNPKRWSLDPP